MSKQNNKYFIEPHVRTMVEALVKAYPFKKLKYENAILKSKEMDGQPRGTGTSDVVVKEAAERIKLYYKFLMPVEKALEEIPEEYRQGVINKIAFGMEEPYYAAKITWKRYRRKFRYYVAYFADYI